MNQQDHFIRSVLADPVGEEVMAVLGELPKRWGRMDILSRLAVAEVGRVLSECGRFDQRAPRIPKGMTVGLIGGTRFGSLVTDLDFAATCRSGVNTASPLLFGYTLPNIALAEAASHYGFIGPVYSVFSDDPMAEAVRVAARWQESDPLLGLMVAGEIDFVPEVARLAFQAGEVDGGTVTPLLGWLSIKFTIVS
ncbi:MAG: hypothetical protein KJ950_00585 [Proteobacteria bacterium]|nr:hypothetical protein [Pseudomonadota bacterium]MBU1685849.1 hypothetical protein [Pseudomonadota bacterium]